MAAISLRAPAWRRSPFRTQSVFYTVVLAGLAILVLWPLFLILVNSFQVSRPGQPPVFSLEPWRVAMNDPTILSAMWNTLTLTLARQAISLPVAILLAWTLARTDIPGAHWLEFMFWIAFFLPALPVTLGWILLLDPQYGLLNQLLKTLPFVQEAPFNIYSFWGIVWAHVAHSTIAIKVMILTPAFRNLDASLEEASLVSGSSTMGTVLRIVVPIMTPVILVTLLLSFIHSLQSFEVETILGPPFRFYVFSTKIYQLIHQEPPLYASGTALSAVILGIVVPLLLLQRWATERRSFTTVSGQYRSAKIRLHKWRAPAFALVLLVGFIVTVIPTTFLVLGTFMRLFGFFNLQSPWTTDNWVRVLQDPIFVVSVRNTLVLAMGTAVSGMLLCAAIAYICVRTRFRGRAALDYMSWLPSTLPGIILSLGMLWMLLGTPAFRPLYGTIISMILAALVSSLTLGVQTVKSNLVQFGTELEEAASIGGGNWWHVATHVLLPLLAPALFLVGTLSFVSAARNVSTMALLATSDTRPLSLLQLDFMVEGRYEAAAVTGVLVVVLTTGVAIIGRLAGMRFGVRD